MKYKHILFDLDGTLIDAQKSVMDSLQFALRQFGIEPDYATLGVFMGPPIHSIFEQHFGFDSEKAEKAVQHYREYYAEHGRKEIRLIEGYRELLQRLVEHNKSLYIATSKPKPVAEEIIRDLHLDHFFTAIIGNSLVARAVEKDVLIGAVLKLSPEEPKSSYVMIGDRKYDVIGAQDNGIDSVGMLLVNIFEDEILESKPTYIARSVKELEEILHLPNA